jgi:hypothetical protein
MDRRLQTLVLKKGHAKAPTPTCPLFLCIAMFPLKLRSLALRRLYPV